MAITTYATLVTAISSWVERSADGDYTGEVDTFIDFAEAAINRHLAGHWLLDESVTLTTDASGEATLPSDFLAPKSVIWDGSNDCTLSFVSWGTLQNLNPTNIGGVPTQYSIQGTKIKVSPIAEGDILLTYSEKLPALSVSNETNWLLDRSPDVYLLLSLSAGHLFNEAFEQASVARNAGLAFLDEEIASGNMAQYRTASVILERPSP